MAHFVAERLRRAIADEPFVCSAPEGKVTVTTSIGGALIRGETTSVVDALKRADDALYAAKEGGRNATYFENIGKLDPSSFLQDERKAIS